MPGPSNSGASDDLNFDRAESAGGGTGAAPNQCANCGKPLGISYHTANGAPICSSCRGKLSAASLPIGFSGTLGKAIVFGFGAAIVGAIIYYAVMRYLNLEIGIIAILTGWMVGTAMSKATVGRGGRLLQVSAALLTYISVAMAYFPFAMQQMSEIDTSAPPVMPADTTVFERLVDSAAVAAVMDSMNAAKGADSTAATPEVQLTEADLRALRDENAPPVNPIIALALVAGFAFILPILVIVGSLPGGIISAAIIGFGIVKAWQMTAAPSIAFEGPFKLAGTGSDEGDART